MRFAFLVPILLVACSSSDDAGTNPDTTNTDGGTTPDTDKTGVGDSTPAPLPKASCMAAGGTTTVSAPELQLTLKDRYQEGWLASPAVADLDGDGKNEIVVVRESLVEVWDTTGALKWKYDTAAGRIWSSPVVANFTGDGKLEIAVASRKQVHLIDATGKSAAGFPVTWEDEMRAIGAGDLDGDGKLDIAASVGHGSPTDVLNAWHGDGTPVAGFPPNATGTSGCASTKCYLAGCYDQNLAVGDLDGDGHADLIAPHDNAYASFHHGSGVAFDAASIFTTTKKTPGIRYLHDLAEAIQGYSDHEATSLQAHFTNTAPAIADVDGDGKPEVIMLASVQNASQDDRLKGVGLWVMHPDGSRLAGWETPFHAPGYIAGLWDLGDNIVGATNQVTVADIDPSSPGPEFVFAGFDGKIHGVSAKNKELWSFSYTTEATVLTGGVVVADLSGDGVPEIVFNTYSTDKDKSALYVLDAGGNQLHKVALSGRGAMAVPTIADVDGNGTLEIVVSLKDAVDKVESARVYTVKSSKTNCQLWPTGRANLLRNGFIPPK
ncbi:MAG: FG-GAP repeat domain-containing protein [Polyangiales bacterium]